MAILRRLVLEHRCDLATVSAVVTAMQGELPYSTRCQLARRRPISRGDAFANAFVVAHTTVDLLFLELRRLPRLEGAGPPTGSGS